MLTNNHFFTYLNTNIYLTELTNSAPHGTGDHSRTKLNPFIETCIINAAGDLPENQKIGVMVLLNQREININLPNLIFSATG